MIEQSCNQCGECCHYEIPITLYDIHRIAGHLGCENREVFEKYIQNDVSPLSGLYKISKKSDRACVFLDDQNRCSIHAAKPLVCELFNCDKANRQKSLPWTSTCHDDASRIQVWRQSLAVAITRAYIERNGVIFNDESFKLAISSIEQQSGCDRQCNVKLSQDNDGNPMAMIYCCDECQRRKETSRETPVTLHDIESMRKLLQISPEEFFTSYVDRKVATDSGVLRLKRSHHCVLLGQNMKCMVEKSRPMHCRFTPCPMRTEQPELMDRFYLGSGTLEEQFIHQIALDQTRKYLSKNGTGYHQAEYTAFLSRIMSRSEDKELFQQFCKWIAPYRYLEDTLSVR